MRKSLFFICLLAGWPIYAQVQSPEKFLGYALGEQFTRHHKMIDYYEHLAATSPSVQLKEYGLTYEGRPLVYAIVTSRANHSNLESIRLDNLRRAGLESGSPTTNIPIVWLSYNVHGNESVSMEAGMATIYELITGKATWLEHVVVIIDPCLNPDGRDRYANFYSQYGNKNYNPDPQSKEHNEQWPGGRANHYLFDLNRDWAWQTQMESQRRIEVYNQWMPQVHVDFHEQDVNSPYYMAPAAQPYHELITKWQDDFQVAVGKNNARYFDEKGWLYFTREHFDLLYPSYGDTYPMYNGAIGMTYEQAGSGHGGLGVLTDEGDTLTLKDRIAHHHSNGLSTVEVTVTNKERVLEEYKKYFKTNINSFPGKYKGFVIKGDNNADQLAGLTTWLNALGIDYGTGAAKRSAKGFSYQSLASESFTLEAEDVVISCYQPRGVLASILFEPGTFLSDSNTYDITAWGLPFAKGLKAYALTDKVTPGSGKYKTPVPEVPSATKPYSYLARWQSLNDAKFLAELLRLQVKVRYATVAFSIDGQSFAPGSLIITRRGNEHLGSRFDAIVKETAHQQGRSLYATSTGMMDTGNDLGSGNVRFIHSPKVAVLAGSGVSSLSFGETWHFFDQQINYPVSVLEAPDIENLRLSTYQVIILPNGGYNTLNDDALKKIDEWVKSGGRLILIQGALQKFVKREGYSLTRYVNEEEKTSAEKLEESWKTQDTHLPHASRERNDLMEIIPGAIYKATVDHTHPLAFGYAGNYFSLKTSESRFSVLQKGHNVAYIPPGGKPVSGFAGSRVQKRLENSLVFGHETLGNGQVVYMVDNPLFRAFWDHGKLLFANAVFLVGQ